MDKTKNRLASAGKASEHVCDRVRERERERARARERERERRGIGVGVGVTGLKVLPLASLS